VQFVCADSLATLATHLSGLGVSCLRLP
jgi:hypothetical protein